MSVSRLVIFSLGSFALCAACANITAQAGGYCGVPFAACRPAYVAPVHVAPAYVAPAPVYAPPQIQVIVQPIGIPVRLDYGVPASKVGFTYSAASAAYQPFDPALFLQQSAKLVENAQTLSGNGLADFQASGLQIRETDAAIEKIRQAGEAIQRVASQEARLQQINSSASGSRAVQVAGTVSQNQNFQNVDQVLQAKCASCHPGFTSWEKLGTDDVRLKVLDRVSSADPNKRMPLAPDKQSPGVPLSLTEKLLFMQQVRGAGN